MFVELQAELIQDRKQHELKNASIKQEKDALEKLKKQMRYSLSLTSKKVPRSSLRPRVQKNAKVPPMWRKLFFTHALRCAKGGYTHIRHDEISDTFDSFWKKLFEDVQAVPELQYLPGEPSPTETTRTEDSARLDIEVNGLLDTQFSKTLFDVKVFNPQSFSCPKVLKQANSYREKLEKLNFEISIIEVEHSSFSPLIVACT